MIKEEKQKAIDALKISTPIMAMTQEEFNDYIQTLNEVMDWLEQEPTTDDAIGRKAVLDAIEDDSRNGLWSCFVSYDDAQKFKKVIKDLQPVNPQPKTGHWVEENIGEGCRKVFCSECGCPPPFEHISTGDVYSSNGYGVINKTKFCPNCGIRMLEPRKSEGE